MEAYESGVTELLQGQKWLQIFKSGEFIGQNMPDFIGDIKDLGYCYMYIYRRF